MAGPGEAPESIEAREPEEKGAACGVQACLFAAMGLFAALLILMLLIYFLRVGGRQVPASPVQTVSTSALVLVAG